MQQSLMTIRDSMREQREAIRKLHDRGLTGERVSAKLATLIDNVVIQLFHLALGELDDDTATQLRDNVAIIGLGSFSRRQCAPFSDVDLMILHQGQNQEELASALRPMTQGIFDIGLQLGHSVRTTQEAVQLARHDTVICTSLIDARLLIGKQELYKSFRENFKRMLQKSQKTICRTFFDAREEERNQYGETVYLLEPHIKRSRGGLRDINLLRWLGYAEHGVADPDRLLLAGAISKIDHRRWLLAREFLLRLRNEMHFHANTSRDMLDRAEQLRLAEWSGQRARAGMLPVERLMREYFRHTNHIWRLVRRRDASLQFVSRIKRALDPVLGKNVGENYRVGLNHVSATSTGIEMLKTDLGEVLRLVELSAKEKKHLDHRTFSTLLLNAPEFPDNSIETVGKQFYDLLADPDSAPEILRVLHELGYLEKIIPAFRHARCLLQFNQYHKFTVDEHSLRAVRYAARFAERKDTLGAVYREIEDKRIIHLVLLLHDLGKGFEEDHSEVGKRIAEETGQQLELDQQTVADMAYLVHQHLMMAHLTFRRDTSDENLLRNFAEDVGTVERLKMLFVLTCADLAAVGPGVLNDWKIDVLASVYRRTAQLIESDDEEAYESELEKHRRQISKALTPQEQTDSWYERQIKALSRSYMAEFEIDEVVDTLRRYHGLADRGVDAKGTIQEETETICFVAGVDQGTGRGVFSSMAGALSEHGLPILSAHTDVLADDLLMLRYVVSKPADPHESSPERLDQICQAMTESVDSDRAPRFPKVWGEQEAEASIQLSMLPNEVRIDNEVSADFSVVEIFTFDRKGLLYTLARKLHDLSMIIRHAMIGTYLDQVVDVFYVTDREGQKIEDQAQLEGLRNQLLEVIELN